jgi:hypothetical protein
MIIRNNHQQQLTNSSLCKFGAVEFNHTSATGAAVRLVLDLSTIDLTDRREQVDQILVTGRPGQLSYESAIDQTDQTSDESISSQSRTYVANIDNTASLAAGGCKVSERVRGH